MKKILYSTILFFQIHFTFSQVVINEVMVKPGTDATSSVFQTLFSCTQPTQGNEYIELYNSDPCNAVDISCWILATPYNGISASTEGSIRFPAGTIIPPLGFISIGGPASGATINLATLCPSSTTGNIVTGGSRWFLDNLDSYIALYNSTGTPVDVVYWTLVSNAANRWNNPTYDALVNAPTKITNPTGCSALTSLAGPSTLPLSIVSYAGQAPSMGTVIERTTDGGATWTTNSAPTINNCNGTCLTSSAFDLNATIVQPSCGNNDGSISFSPTPASTYFYSWPFPSSSTVSSQTGLSPGTYDITITNSVGCSIDTSIILVDVPCGNVCDPTGNLVIYSNYDGGILTINVDQNIPNLKVGICTYEPIQVNFTGPFVGNITQVIYAGMNSNQNNNNCGLGNFTTSITGVPVGIVTISPPMNPPSVGYTPAHGNGSGPWGGLMYCGYSCDTLTPLGGANTPDEIVYYFQNATSGTLLYHQTQYACWVNETLNVSAGGNCCILPPGLNPCTPPTMTSPNSASICSGAMLNIPLTSNLTGATFSWIANANNNVDGESIIEQTNNVINNTLTNTTTSIQTIVYAVTPTANGCAGTPQTVNVTVNPYPTTPTITTTAASCSAAGTATISNYVGTQTYTFSPSGPSAGAGGVISSMTIGTSYTVTASKGSCSSTVSSLFNIAESNSFNVVENINPATCDASDGSISLSTLGGMAPFSYNWLGGGSTTDILTNVSAGNYSVTVTDQNGCSVTENYLVTQINTFDFDVLPTFSSITSGETVQFNANGAISYNWSPSSSLNCNDCPNPIATPTENTIYTIIGENSNGCIDTVYAYVSVKEDNFLYVPNTFTPDGDEFNNVFIPCISDSFDPQSYTLFIFNRWGELIFETKDLNEGWNGTYNGKLQQKGVYTWGISLKTKELDDIKEYHGHVLLIR